MAVKTTTAAATAAPPWASGRARLRATLSTGSNTWGARRAFGLERCRVWTWSRSWLSKASSQSLRAGVGGRRISECIRGLGVDGDGGVGGQGELDRLAGAGEAKPGGIGCDTQGDGGFGGRQPVVGDDFEDLPLRG